MSLRTSFTPVLHRHQTLPRWHRLKTKQPYPRPLLAVVMDRHADRLRDFLVQKKFFAHESEAQEFYDYIDMHAESGRPQFLLHWNLKQLFSKRSRASFAYKDAKVTASLAQEFCDLLDDSAILYPYGGFEPADILDIGCGPGIIAEALAGHYVLPPARVVGVDIFPPNHIPDSITFRQIEPDSVIAAVGTECYDLAVLSMVLHHSANPEMLLAEAYAALRPGGYLLLKEHDAPKSLHDFLDVIHIFHEQIFPKKALFLPSARNYRTLDEWKRAARIAGFEAENISYKRYERGSANTGNNFILLLRKDR